jgi:hypothetical protein
MGTNSATPFLWGAGTSNNGLLTSLVPLMSTELNGLANASGIVSSALGLSTNGIFNNTLTGQGIYGDVSFLAGGAFTPTAGGNINGWFIRSRDGGTTYEYSGATPTRPPDFVIPLVAAAYAANQQAWSMGVHAVRIPATYFKVYVVNSAGVTLYTSGNTLTLDVVGLDY